MIENNFFIWEENNNTLPIQTSCKRDENDKCDITNETKKKSEREISNPIIPKNSGIYKIIHKESGKYYIGRTNNFKRRWYRHKYELNKNKHDNQHLQNAWNKYGKNNFDFCVVEYVENNFNKLKETEEKYLKIIYEDKKNWNNKYYNLSEFSGDQYQHSEETKKKLSESHLGIKLSDQAKQRLSILNTGCGNPFYGKKHSIETKEKISKKIKGKNHPFYKKSRSDETKRKLSEKNKGKKLSDEHKIKLSKINKGRIPWNLNKKYCYCHTDETKKKISESNKGKVFANERKEKISKSRSGKNYGYVGVNNPNSILIKYNFYNTNKNIYRNCTRIELIREFNLNPSNVSSLFRGRRNVVNGWILIK
jgi:group I intron endonuclease